MYHANTIQNIRKQFAIKLSENDFVVDKSGVKMLELISASFIANDETIFASPNYDYIKREIAWYESQSLNVNDIPGGTPEIWKQVSSKKGLINSNYGWAIFSEKNGNQYQHTLEELKSNPNSRRAVMIYNRPSMHKDYSKGGMSDFMCTNAVQYLIRNGQLEAVVQMRSNDAVYGYRNDVAWQKYVLLKLANDLNVSPGSIYWNAGSLHIYSRHFYLVEHYSQSFEPHITKSDFIKEYPNSPWAV